MTWDQYVARVVDIGHSEVLRALEKASPLKEGDVQSALPEGWHHETVDRIDGMVLFRSFSDKILPLPEGKLELRAMYDLVPLLHFLGDFAVEMAKRGLDPRMYDYYMMLFTSLFEFGLAIEGEEMRAIGTHVISAPEVWDIFMDGKEIVPATRERIKAAQIRHAGHNVFAPMQPLFFDLKDINKLL